MKHALFVDSKSNWPAFSGRSLQAWSRTKRRFGWNQTGKSRLWGPMRRQRREIFREGLYIAVKNRISGKWRVPVLSPESFSMSKKFPTLRDLFFDFAMTEKVGFTNTGELLSNSQSCLSRFRRSRQIKKRLRILWGKLWWGRKKISGRCCRYLQLRTTT